MAQLTVQEVDLAGETLAFDAAAAGGDSFPLDPGAMLVVENTDTVAHDVTVDSQQNCDQGFDHDITVTVAAGDTEIIGGLDEARFSDADGLCHLSYSGNAGMNVAVIRQTG